MTIKWFQKSTELVEPNTSPSNNHNNNNNNNNNNNQQHQHQQCMRPSANDLLAVQEYYEQHGKRPERQQQQQQQQQEQEKPRPSLVGRMSLAKSQSCQRREAAASPPANARLNRVPNGHTMVKNGSPTRPPRSPVLDRPRNAEPTPLTAEIPANMQKHRASPRKSPVGPISPVSSSSSSSLSPDPKAFSNRATKTPTDKDRDQRVNDHAATAATAGETRQGRQNSLFGNIHFSWLTSMSGRGSILEEGSDPNNSASVTKHTEHAEEVQIAPQSVEMGVIMQGWLEKCGQQFKTWNWRFFVLRDDGVLSYYADEQMKKLKGSIHVGYGSQANVSIQANLADKKNVFMIATPQRKTMITAPNRKIMSKWIARLQAIGANPSAPWDPLRKTVNYFVRDAECPHEWKRYDDPTSYIHMEGCLTKRGHIKKNWKNRYFRIEKGELRYYTDNQEELKGSMPLKDTVVSPGMAQCPDGRKYYFVLTSKDSKVELHLNAHNEQDMHKWIEALQEAQIALREKGTNTTQTGLALVIKRAEEFPLAKFSVEYKSPTQVEVEMEKRTEALIVTSSGAKDVIPKGSQLIAVNGKSTLRASYGETRAMLRASRFPLQMDFLLPPSKIGLLVKKSRTGFENWKKRVVMVVNGEIRYFKQLDANSMQLSSLKHRKSFSLYGCYMNLTEVPNRAHCIVVARSPSDKLVLETPSEEERIDWASVIYCSIRMASQGITSGHIANLHLESAVLEKQPQGAVSGSHAAKPARVQQDTDLHGSFNSDCNLEF